MKMQADKNRSERSFVAGDWVYLKLQPYVQLSVSRRSNQKLSYKYFGPYLILQKVGVVAYKLQLPASSQIHPVVHVCQLKKALPPAVEVSPDDALNYLNSLSASVPVHASEPKLYKIGNGVTLMVQVSWSNMPQTWRTWENVNYLHQEFPEAMKLLCC
jgi:hypothetical protein